MQVAIIQSNYVPWRGYFDFIDDADIFVFLDDVQYTKSDWRNRNRIKLRNGTSWLTVPVHRDGLQIKIEEARINYSKPWQQLHKNMLTEGYRNAPFFSEIFALFCNEIDRSFASLSELNINLIRAISSYLSVETRFVQASDISVTGVRTERLVSIVQALGGKSYLSGPSAEAYLEPAAFRAAGIELVFKSYDYEPYPQLWGEFDGAVSILDLLMNTGPEARRHVKSCSPNRAMTVQPE